MVDYAICQEYNRGKKKDMHSILTLLLTDRQLIHPRSLRTLSDNIFGCFPKLNTCAGDDSINWTSYNSGF